MPSSHAAAVAALTTAVGLREGFGSTIFGVTLYLSLVIMYDAAGLRQAAGRQARILNRLIDMHNQAQKRSGQEMHRLIEELGHTPFEVLVGALLGSGSALAWNWLAR